MIGLSLAKPPIEFLFGVLTGIAVLLLDQTDELIGFATHPSRSSSVSSPHHSLT